MKRLLTLSATTLLLASCSSASLGDTAIIESVVDAITFRTEGGHRIRMMGVRSPGVGSPVQCYGKEALLAAESLVGTTVRLEVEPLLERAQDGTYPRYFWLETQKQVPVQTGSGETASGAITETTSEEILVNERALEMGTAFPLVSEDMIHGERMLSAARFASATQKGLWGACEVSSTETPQGNVLQTQAATDCVIKAKILKDGTKMYRTPDCPAYAETLVLRSNGGEWFCAEDTAQDAGFTLAEDC